MGNTPTTSFRLAPELLERLDRYAERLATAAGVPVSRAAAAAKLLTTALDQVELPQTEMMKRDAHRHAWKAAQRKRGAK
jgi:DNA-binding ferritin-like protein